MSTAPKKTKKNPKGLEVTEELKFTLTAEELAVKAKLASQRKKDYEAAFIEFKTEQDKHRAVLRTLAAEKDKLLDEVHEGREARRVACVRVRNDETGHFEYWFEGALIESREMTDEEKAQPAMDLNPPKPTKKTRTVKAEDAAKRKKVEEPKTESEQIAEVRKLETGRGTKASAVDGPVGNGKANHSGLYDAPNA